MELDHQVIIVGGGPVGVALAVQLGQRGIACALVERRHTPRRIPKGQNLTQRTLEHFYFWNCVDELRAARLMPPGYPIAGITAYGNLMSDYWFTEPGRGVVGDYYFQANDRLPQYLTEEVLRARARQIPAITCLFGWQATAVEQDDDGVRVRLVEVDAGSSPARPGGERLLTAAYAVGCDGARSSVREQIGIERTAIRGRGPDSSHRMVLTVFRSRELHEGLRRFPDRTTYRVMNPALRGYWQFFGRVDVGEGWFFHSPVPDGVEPGPDEVHKVLERAAGFSFTCEFDHLGFWDLRVELADRYRKGRVFIAGDAAHTHPPYGGFGLNTGLEDAVNLGWKLTAVLEGWAGDPLLDSYGAERLPVFAETGKAVIGAGIEEDRAFLDRYSPERDRAEFERAWAELAHAVPGPRSYEPHYEGSPVVAGPAGGSCGVQGSHSFTARPGHHLAPCRLSSGRNVFEELGTGLTLLAFGGDSHAFTRASGALRVPLTVVRDSYGGERRAYGSPLILVRPDQFVAWTGSEPPEDPSHLLRTVTGR
jgi:2-polyprenyl-6-methoxyphenol hydroxylase-like FAD-dependent oxidoreductase